MSASLPARLENVRRALTERDSPLDALLLTDLENIGYVTGFTGSTAYALVTPDEALLITDSRYTLRALAECRTFEVRETPSGSGGYGEALQTVLSERPGLRRLGFEAGHVTVSLWESFRKLAPDVEWVSTEGIVGTLRLVKDADEIARIRRAIASRRSRVFIRQAPAPARPARTGFCLRVGVRHAAGRGGQHRL